MPAVGQADQQEQQLVLLEDEVFDFDDVVQQLSNSSQEQLKEVATQNKVEQTAPQQNKTGANAAAREVRDTREIIVSMLHQQPLMTVDTTPSAYLEYLRIIFNCAKLIRQPAMPADLIQSVTSLLAKAKSLFCANAFSLLVHTLNAVGGGSDGNLLIPAFWAETFSQHESRLWIELIETVFFFWSDSDSSDLRGRRRDDIIVEGFAVSLLERLSDLRSAYAEVPSTAIEKARNRAEQLAREVRQRLRPRHLLTLTQVKKIEKTALPALAVFDCFLEAAGALPVVSADAATAASKPTLSRTKAALEAITFEHVRSALRLHRSNQFEVNLKCLNRLRQRHLCKVELREPRGRLRDQLISGGCCARDPDLPDILAAFIEYAIAACEFELLWQHSVVKNATVMGPFLLDKLSSLVAKNIARAKSSGCWETLSDFLQADLQLQSERRLSALTTESRPAEGSRSDTPGQETGNSYMTFELDIVATRSRDFCPEFIVPGTDL